MEYKTEFEVLFPARRFPAGAVVKNLPEMKQMQVQSLGWEDPLGEEMAIHANILAWEMP